jgi:hypothetical protein
MARRAARGLADMRALEEQRERHNPVNPKKQIGAYNGSGMARMVGQGATPSSGLSQFRGGATDDEIKQAAYEVAGMRAERSQNWETCRGTMRSRGLNPEEMRRCEAIVRKLEAEAKKEDDGDDNEIGHLNVAKSIIDLGKERDPNYRQVYKEPYKKAGEGRKSGKGNTLKTMERASNEDHIDSRDDDTKEGSGRRGKKKGMSEATMMGLHLGKHLHSLHGGSFHKEFAKGMCDARGGAWWDFLDPNKNGLNASIEDTKHKFDDFGAKVKNEFVNPDSVLRQGVDKVGHEFTDPNSLLRGTYLPEAANIAGKVASVADFIPGVGEVVGPIATAIKGAQMANQAAKAVGYGKKGIIYEKSGCGLLGGPGGKRKMMPGVIGDGGSKASKSGAYEGMGKKKRAPAGPNDGRKRRAEIVRKVMAEKGMKMIDASKYVKQHNLY